MNMYSHSDSTTVIKILYRYEDENVNQLRLKCATLLDKGDVFISEEYLIKAIRYILDYKEGKVIDTNRGESGDKNNEQFIEHISKIIDQTLEYGCFKPEEKEQDSKWDYPTFNFNWNNFIHNAAE